MEKIVTGKGMKKADYYTIHDIGIPSMVLMERAALAMYTFFKKKANKGARILCVCGMGNNGADGVALARLLVVKGYQADIITVGNEEKATEEWKLQRKIADKLGVKISSWESVNDNDGTEDRNKTYNEIWADISESYDYVVDALFGIGLTRNVEGQFADIIQGINHVRDIRESTGRSITVVAADVPSGLNADDGKIMGCAIKADVTITFGAMKSGLLLYMGKDMAGKVIVKDIGFPDSAYVYGPEVHERYYAITDEDISQVIKRPAHSNKGTYGKVLVVAGSENMYGAAYLTSMAALKTGCGLLRIITHKNNRELLYKMIPEAIIQVYDNEYELTPDDLEKAVLWSDAVVIGPGLGTEMQSYSLVKNIMQITGDKDKYVVIDADGLNIISADDRLKELYHDKTVITPHLGEASRLMKVPVKEIAENLVDSGRQYSGQHGINVVLKDSATVILGIESFDNKCNNRVCINTSGNAGMATAGSGDVLAGIIAAVLAGGIDITSLVESYGRSEADRIFIAAALAVYIHGKAGDLAADRCGQISMTATDILNMIYEILAG